MMNAVSKIIAQERLDTLMEEVCSDRLPVVITRDSEPAVVLISLEDYKSLQETAYLLQSPNNAKRLMEAINDLESGKGAELELLD